MLLLGLGKIRVNAKIKKIFDASFLHNTICTSFGKLFLTQIKDPVEMGPDVIIDWTAAGRLPVSMLTALLIMF